jgi:hypothetical protein
MAALAVDELATYGGARAMVDWHARHHFARAAAARACS